MSSSDDNWWSLLIGFLIVLAVIISVILGIFYGYKKMSVWSNSLSGQAELARADYNRKIVIVEAQSQKEAARFKAEADIIRAEGIAKANKIIGESLEGNQSYLEWKFIDELPQQKNQVIYLPTNNFLPITEAGRRHEGKQ